MTVRPARWRSDCCAVDGDANGFRIPDVSTARAVAVDRVSGNRYGVDAVCVGCRPRKGEVRAIVGIKQLRLRVCQLRARRGDAVARLECPGDCIRW